MKFKCIEQITPCIHKKKFGENYYCDLSHAPNHVWKKENGTIEKIPNQCAEEKTDQIDHSPEKLKEILEKKEKAIQKIAELQRKTKGFSPLPFD
jgi:hypothetical protein